MKMPSHREIAEVTNNYCDVYKTKEGILVCGEHPGSYVCAGDDICMDMYHSAERMMNAFLEANNLPTRTVLPLSREELAEVIYQSLNKISPFSVGVTVRITDEIISLHQHWEYPSKYDYQKAIHVGMTGRDIALDIPYDELSDFFNMISGTIEEVTLYMRQRRDQIIVQAETLSPPAIAVDIEARSL